MFVSYIVNKYSDVIVANSKATGEAITNNKNKLKNMKLDLYTYYLNSIQFKNNSIQSLF